MLNNKAILITGGTGSLRKKLAQVIVQEYKPDNLYLLPR